MMKRTAHARLKRDRLRNSILSPHVLTIEERLTGLGASDYSLLPEAHILPLLIRLDEQITGLVYGRYSLNESGKVSRGALIATTERLLLIDKQTAYFISHDLLYRLIKKVSFNPPGQVVISSDLGNITMSAINLVSALGFVSAVHQQLANS